MAELTVEIPGLLKQDIGKIKKEVSELIFLEEKRKSLSLLIDKVIKGETS